jgi:hypothetical protein
MANRQHFAPGSGCFVCEDCGKRTRNTGDNGQCNLCPDCFEIAGIENEISDCGDEDGLLQSQIDAIRASQGGAV